MGGKEPEGQSITLPTCTMFRCTVGLCAEADWEGTCKKALGNELATTSNLFVCLDKQT